jgi:hypothetical protein
MIPDCVCVHKSKARCTHTYKDILHTCRWTLPAPVPGRNDPPLHNIPLVTYEVCACAQAYVHGHVRLAGCMCVDALFMIYKAGVSV